MAIRDSLSWLGVLTLTMRPMVRVEKATGLAEVIAAGPNGLRTGLNTGDKGLF
jgi:hypothetical protein